MVSLNKALIFGFGVWISIALLGAILPIIPLLDENTKKLLLIPISALIIMLAAAEYLKEIHAQYELEGLEIAGVWAGMAIVLEGVVFSFFYGYGIAHFLSIGTWLGILFKAIFPVVTGLYMQHTLTK